MKLPLDHAAGYDHIWLSPHPDDAVWSAGGQLALQRRAGRRVLVVTLCTAPPADLPDGDAPALATGALDPSLMQVRLCEDAAALARLDVDFVHAGLRDGPERLPVEYGSLRRLMGGEPAPGDPLTEEVRRTIDTLRARNPAALLHAPLGIGGHVDHVAVARAAPRDSRTWFYEDVPYCLSDPTGEDARRLVPDSFVADVVDVTSVFPARLAASACYRTQIPLLFGKPAQMLEAMRRHARALAPEGGLAERRWRPPLGDAS